MSELEAGGAPAPAAAPAIESTPSIDTAPPAVGAPEPKPEPTIDDTLNAAWDKAQTGVERGEGGKFVAKNADAPAETKSEDSAVQPTETPVETVKPSIDAPNTWTAEAREHWAKLPPETQEYILRRESESHKAITSQGDRLKSYEPLEKVISQYRQDFERRGLDAARSVATLFEAQRMLDQNPMEGLASIAQSYGIDLRAILTGQQQAPAPEVGQLRQHISRLEQQLNDYQSQHQSAQQRADAAVVQEFAKQTDASGKPLRPHFDEVREDMAMLLQNGRAETLEAAYEKACKLNETVSKRIEADQRKAAEEKRKAEEAAKQAELKKRAEDAAKAAKVNVKSGTAHPTPKTLDDTLAEIARRAYG